MHDRIESPITAANVCGSAEWRPVTMPVTAPVARPRPRHSQTLPASTPSCSLHSPAHSVFDAVLRRAAASGSRSGRFFGQWAARPRSPAKRLLVPGEGSTRAGRPVR